MSFFFAFHPLFRAFLVKGTNAKRKPGTCAPFERRACFPPKMRHHVFLDAWFSHGVADRARSSVASTKRRAHGVELAAGSAPISLVLRLPHRCATISVFSPSVPAVARRRRVLVQEWVEGEKGPWKKDGEKLLTIGLQCSVLQVLDSGTSFLRLCPDMRPCVVP